MSRSVCLVTEELYPFTPGGIGRLLHNLVRDALARDASLSVHVLAPEGVGLEPAAVQAALGARVTASTFGAPVASFGPRRFPGAEAFSHAPAHGRSLAVAQALLALEAQGRRFDVVEFCDFRGWAFAALMEKRLGLNFAATTLAVRLHGPESLVAWEEGALAHPHLLATWELERLSLLHADVVVAHLRPVASRVTRFFGLPASWWHRLKVQFPPAVAPVPKVEAFAGQRDLVFPTKLQAIKRPDLFVDAAVQVMQRRPGYGGRAVLATAIGSDVLEAQLKARVPAALASRFEWRAASEAERLELFRRGVVAVPSDYESLSLTAWEAAVIGAPVVLQSGCPAFADGTPLAAWPGAHRFDGTVAGLAKALEAALDAPPPAPALQPIEAPYWLDTQARAQAASGELPTLAAVVVPGGGEAASVASVLAGALRPAEVVTATAVDADGAPVKVVRPAASGLPALDDVLAATAAPLLMLLRGGDTVTADFVSLAAHALARCSDVDVVVPTAQLHASGEVVPMLGGAPSLGAKADVVGALGVVRREALAALPADVRRAGVPPAEVLLHLALAGRTMLATNDVQATAHAAGQDASERLRFVPRPLPPTVHPLALAELEQVPSLRAQLEAKAWSRLGRVLPRATPRLKSAVSWLRSRARGR